MGWFPSRCGFCTMIQNFDSKIKSFYETPISEATKDEVWEKSETIHIFFEEVRKSYCSKAVSFEELKNWSASYSKPWIDTKFCHQKTR